jgi:nucleoside-diphosphate-sugar epimerase
MAATAFVTGATGFIGTRLVHELVRRGHTVHALTRTDNPQPPPGFSPDDRPSLRHPNVRLCPGDITDLESLRRGMQGCEHVYHLAGYAKNWAANPQTYIEINANGMKNVCTAARELAVERVVWTSTMLTFGPTRPGEVGDEAMPRITPKYYTQYEASKCAAEAEAAKFVADGLPLVIVNPGRVFGPGHFSEGNALSLLIDMYDRGRAPILLNGGRNVGNFVYVNDVVAGHIGAMERGRVGEKYLLGGENLSLKEYFGLIDKVSGKRHFQINIRRLGAMTYAWLLKQRAQIFGAYPQITPDWVRVFLTEWAFSSAKAELELGYRITPMEHAVRQTYEWLLRVREEKRRAQKTGN